MKNAELKPELPIFQSCLGVSFSELPEAVQSLHNNIGRCCFSGVAESKGPTGFSGRLTARLFGFPEAAQNIPVKVTITADAVGEYWCRDFDGCVFESKLDLHSDGYITERFGPMKMRLGLVVKQGVLYFPVVSGKLFGYLPAPKLLLYRGWLVET